MPKLITVSEYCNINNVSVQSVYARIKRGTLKAEIHNGVKMVFNDNLMDNTTHTEREVNDNLNSYTTLLQSTIKDQKKEIKRLHKTIRDLEKQRLKSIDTVLKILMGDIIPMQIETKNKDIIDVAIKDAVYDQPIKKAKKKSKTKKKK